MQVLFVGAFGILPLIKLLYFFPSFLQIVSLYFLACVTNGCEKSIRMLKNIYLFKTLHCVNITLCQCLYNFYEIVRKM